jgi:hypothetical protein
MAIPAAVREDDAAILSARSPALVSQEATREARRIHRVEEIPFDRRWFALEGGR